MPPRSCILRFRAVAFFRRDGQGALSPDFHAGDAFVPAGDHLPGAQAEAERIAPSPEGPISLVVVATLVHRGPDYATLLAWNALKP